MGIVPVGATSLARELPIVLGGIGLFYSLIAFARYWSGPVSSQPEISLHPTALPKYALFSVLRIAIAYIFSFLFTLVYGYVAAYNRKAERFMIPLLDTLQSIPVLSFLPGVMISMAALFPSRQLGVELGSVLLIFTGQVWNMTFSFYSSLKSIPTEMREAALAYRLSWWQRFWQLELPQAAIGLIWNSMMSVAGGWFFLMACEMFVLGSRDFRLPGLGSYLQTAANARDPRAIFWGLLTMIGVIILTDQMVWRPVIAWAEKFKLEQVGSAEIPRSPILNLLRRSKLLPFVTRSLVFSASRKAEFALRERPRDTVADKRQQPGTALGSPGGGDRGAGCYRVRSGKSLLHPGNHVVSGIALYCLGRGRHILAGRSCSATCSSMDYSRRSSNRITAQAICHRAADCADCCIGTRDSTVPNHSTRADSRRRWSRNRLDCLAASWHAVVPLVQRDRWCNSNTGGFEGSLQYLPAQRGRALAKTVSSCHISSLNHGFRHGLGRCMECEHRG